MSPAEGDRRAGGGRRAWHRAEEADPQLRQREQLPVRHQGLGAPRVMSLLEAPRRTGDVHRRRAEASSAPPPSRGASSRAATRYAATGWRWIHQFHMSEDEERAFIQAGGRLHRGDDGAAAGRLALRAICSHPTRGGS